MRLFTGIALPAEVRSNLEELVRRLKPLARIKWSPVGNLHITTKFIGEWPEERLEELRGVLRALPPTGPAPIAVRDLGWYPNPRSPRVFWAGIDASEELETLAGATSQALAKLGVPIEKRRFSPHLTLARIKRPADLRELWEELERMPSKEFGEFTAASFHLYRSELGSGGSVYTSLEEFLLGES